MGRGVASEWITMSAPNLPMPRSLALELVLDYCYSSVVVLDSLNGSHVVFVDFQVFDSSSTLHLDFDQKP